MPLKLYTEMDSSATPQVLSRVEVFDDEDGWFYSLTNPDRTVELRVKYAPDFISTRDADRYDCFLFENPYLNAENDVFQIKEVSIEGRFGWIFPVTALDSNENDYATHESFKHYRTIAYQKLLTLEHSVTLTERKESYTLSDLFGNLSVCILSRDEILKLASFKIEDYVLSFLKYDYLLFNGSFKGKQAFDKASELDDLRKAPHSISIRAAAFDITANQYTTSLFIDHVYQTENALTKYILLYQILEHFIQQYGDQLLDDIIREYSEGRVTKNGLREEFGSIKSDRTLLRKTFERTIILPETKRVFLRKCSDLFNDLGLSLRPGFEDGIYELRNLVTHNYRLLTGKTEQLHALIYLFERVILELLTGFNQKPMGDGEEPVEEIVRTPATAVSPVPDQGRQGKTAFARWWNALLERLKMS